MKIFILAIILLTSTANIFSQSNDLIAYYDSEIFIINFQTFGGVHLNYQGQSISPTMGIPKQYKDILSEYSDVKWYIDRYSKKNLIGNILVLGGLAAVIFGAVIPIVKASTDPYYDSGSHMGPEEKAIIFGIGGSISELIGAVILPSSIKELTNGVNLYNRHKLTEYQQMVAGGTTYPEEKEQREENNDLKQSVPVPKKSKISFGVKAAVLDHSYKGYDWDSFVEAYPYVKNDLSFSFSVGALVEIPITSQFSFQPEVKYTSASIQKSENTYWEKSTFGLIEIPLYAKVGIPVTGGKFYVMAGLDIFKFLGDLTWEDSDGDSVTYTNAFDNETSFGFSIAGGYEKDMGSGALLIGLKYSSELINLDTGDEGFFHGFGAEIGYKF